MDLSDKKCVPCEGGAKPLSREEVEEYLKQISSDWIISLFGKEGERFGKNKKLEKKLEFEDFKEAMDFVNKLAELAEQEGHHPDIEISYNKVELNITTHAIGGLSENDFILASKIDKLLD